MSSRNLEPALRNKKYKYESNSLLRINIFMYWMTAVVLIIVAFVFGFYFYNFHDAINIEQANWGEFGDYVGGVLNPIIAFSALLALLVSIGIQSKELAAANELLSQSNFVLKKQNFVAFFFPMLSMHLDFIRQIDYFGLDDHGNDIHRNGSEAFQKHWESLIQHINLQAKKKINVNNKDKLSIEDIQIALEEYSCFEVANIDPYLSNLTSILLIIEKSELSEIDDYYSLLTSNFSRPQWAFLFLILADPFYRVAAEIMSKRSLWQFSYLPESNYNPLIIKYYGSLIVGEPPNPRS